MNGEITVGQLTRRIKNLLENRQDLQQVKLRAEISNLVKHGSGHWYFTLKDEEAQISAVMYKSSAEKLISARFKEGDKVVAAGGVGVYPPRGSYQFIVTALKFDGVGDAHTKFFELKAKLESEGLFQNKKYIPLYPRRIAIVTSQTGAVIRDFCRTLSRRAFVEVFLFTAIVQGESAPTSILRALDKILYEVADIDAVVIARGGGSFEDLSCFNDEKLVRAIADYPLPTISAIGHETDFTITDFVADLRASTPTAAAELLTQGLFAIRNGLADLLETALYVFNARINYFRQNLDDLSSMMNVGFDKKIRENLSQLSSLKEKLEYRRAASILQKRNELSLLTARLNDSFQNLLSGKRRELNTFSEMLQILQNSDNKPIQVLKNDITIRSVKDARKGDALVIRFPDGDAKVKVG